MNASPPTSRSASGSESISVAEIDASCRVPLFVLFVSAAHWLVVASLFGLIASIKFHSPDFLANCAWLTYGRIHPAATNALLYGFAMQAGLGVGLWILARLGGSRAAQPWLIALGAKLWNLGVLVGLVGILAGDSTGFENFEMPFYAAMLLFPAFLMIGGWTVMTLHRRREPALRPSQWFLLAALLWFPWIFSTTHLLLTCCPVRGITQAIVGWWYCANLNFVWLGLTGLAALFYFLPVLTRKELHSESLALFTFWTVVLFASLTGIPNSAPVPAWMPALSTVATVLTLITVITVMLNVCRTVGRGCSQTENPVSGKFIAFGAMAFVVSWLMNIAQALPGLSALTNFTWVSVAQWQLNVYGFFVMTMFGAIYHIVPQVTGLEWPSAKSVRAHYWLAAAGVLLIVVPLTIGGVLQGIKLNRGPMDFVELAKSTLPFLRASTAGELLLLAGHVLLLANLAALTRRYYQTHFAPLYAGVTAELKPAEVKP